MVLRLEKVATDAISPDCKWRSFSKVPNLLQYVSTGTFYGRVKRDGKLYRETLKTQVFSVTKLKLGDFVKEKTRKRRQVGTPHIHRSPQALRAGPGQWLRLKVEFFADFIAKTTEALIERLILAIRRFLDSPNTTARLCALKSSL